ncbi:hypothetical protein B0H10DRAFT_1952951 [Mycena sp. CBHHK59/15]|nr:hypothetical protein B0H10DRAFT_1952951 [Mycena sp. CBHHK59/15]
MVDTVVTRVPLEPARTPTIRNELDPQDLMIDEDEFEFQCIINNYSLIKKSAPKGLCKRCARTFPCGQIFDLVQIVAAIKPRNYMAWSCSGTIRYCAEDSLRYGRSSSLPPEEGPTVPSLINTVNFSSTALFFHVEIDSCSKIPSRIHELQELASSWKHHTNNHYLNFSQVTELLSEKDVELRKWYTLCSNLVKQVGNSIKKLADY